jgi:hypothetical protein
LISADSATGSRIVRREASAPEHSRRGGSGSSPTFGHHAEQTPGRAGWTLTVGGIAAGRYAEPFLPSQAAFSLLGYRTAVADRPRSSACPQIMCILPLQRPGPGPRWHTCRQNFTNSCFS